MTTLTPDTWLEHILRNVHRLDTETLPIGDAVGCTLAETVHPMHALPVWRNSAMDGYAVRSADLEELGPGTPVELTVIGEVPAGSSLDPELGAGDAVRIMTGAPVPSAADTVVAVESTRSDRPGDPWAKDRVVIVDDVRPGANIRAAGEDLGLAEAMAYPGHLLSPARASALAAAGVPEVRVSRRPRIAVVVTGSELVPPGSQLERGQVPESNSVLIAGLAAEFSDEAPIIVRSHDDADQLSAELLRLASSCDVIITTGGVGPGTHDVVRIALEDEPEVRAVRVEMRPGQPQCAGRLRTGAQIFALPGNPVSAAVSFELFVRPALLTMQGRTNPHRLRLTATAGEGWNGRSGRLQVLPVSLHSEEGRLMCRPAVNPRGVSHAVGRHGATDAYALVEAHRGDVAEGESVTVLVLTT